MPSRIEDYALIGDCQTGALVARDSSIDWLCFPRFDAGACFTALLGTPEHGRWLLNPAGEVRTLRRRYREGTLILETEYETAASYRPGSWQSPLWQRALWLDSLYRGRWPMPPAGPRQTVQLSSSLWFYCSNVKGWPYKNRDYPAMSLSANRVSKALTLARTLCTICKATSF